MPCLADARCPMPCLADALFGRCPMPDARCPMHVGYLILLRKAIAFLEELRKKKGTLSFLFLNYCFFLAKLADNWDAKQAISLLTSWRSHLPTYPTKHT